MSTVPNMEQESREPMVHVSFRLPESQAKRLEYIERELEVNVGGRVNQSWVLRMLVTKGIAAYEKANS